MALFIAGLTFTASGQYLRYEISKAIQFEKLYGRALQTAYFWLVVLSGFAFVIGASVIVIALWGFAEHLPLRAPKLTETDWFAKRDGLVFAFWLRRAWECYQPTMSWSR
jgi:hypothetical protein